MSKVVYCHCPKCTKRVHHYVRKGAKKEMTLRCFECNLKFKVEIKDFS